MATLKVKLNHRGWFPGVQIVPVDVRHVTQMFEVEYAPCLHVRLECVTAGRALNGDAHFVYLSRNLRTASLTVSSRWAARTFAAAHSRSETRTTLLRIGFLMR